MIARVAARNPARDDPPAPSGLGGGRALALVAALALGALSYQVNATMVTPVLPQIATAMRTSIARVSEVSSLFFLAGAIAGVVLARWSDFVGRRLALIAVMVALSAGTLVCVFATNLPMLLVGRILQGASSAAYPLAYMILRESLRAEIFGLALGAITAVNGGAGGVDGYVGGLLGEHLGFRSVFVAILGIALLALATVAAVVPKSVRPPSAGKMDWRGAAILSIALVALNLFVSEGSTRGWASPAALGALLGAAAAFAAFTMIERAQASPLIATHHLRSRQVWPVLATTVLTLSGVFAVINFTVVLLSQDRAVGYGLGAATAALMFLSPTAIVGVVSAPVAGWLAARRGWIRMLRIGLLLSVLLLVLIASAPRSLPVVLISVALLGLTYNGLALTALNGLGVLLSPSEAPAALPGLNGAAFGIGAGLGIGLVAPFAGAKSLTGYTDALWISAGVTALALLASAFIRPRPEQPE
ncbi:MAG TPA: MFS transporter [Caulobacteraceae bacterium]|jgi:predicted MFS family arabinose efflux permease|nr:MFS transporter [Caulobacteraceae bacterium]